MRWENVMKTAVRVDGTLHILNQLDLFDQDRNNKVVNSWKFKMKIYYERIKKCEDFFANIKQPQRLQVAARTSRAKIRSTRYDSTQ